MKKLLFLCPLLFAAGTVRAEPPLGFYGGAGLTTGSVDNFLHSGLDISNTSWKLFAGLHPSMSPVGAEVEYLDFGSQTQVGAHAEGHTAAVDLVGYLPLPVPQLSLYGKAGFSRWALSGSLATPGGPVRVGVDDNGVQFTWGVGAQAHFGNLAARLEYERFNINNTDGANIVTIGVQVTLL